MRNFIDCWQFLFTNGGKPLVGKIEFCEANTTSLKTIYDIDGQELDNPIYVNGVTDYQVMLDGDYTARFYEYIGDGIMVGDTAPEHWKLFKTELLKGESETTVVEDGAIIDTIDDLKNLVGMHDGDCVEVLGYNTKEDCPARFYVWHDSGQWADDGGVWIRSNNTTQGAWVMKIPGSYIDVRWYGDIPNSTTSAPTTHMGARAYAAAAANRYHKDLYFPSYNGAAIGYYLFDGSNTVSVQKDIILDNGVRFVIKENTSGTFVSCHEMKACDKTLFVSELGKTIGNYTLEADWINVGWYGSNVATATGARVGYVVENMHSPMTISNRKVKLVNVAQPLTLNNCEVVEGHKVLNGNVTLYGMDVKTDWFADNYAYQTSLHLYNNCRIKLDNCKDANTYIILKNIAGDYNYGDLGEQSINATVYSGGTIENCYGTITVADSSGNLEFHNVTLLINGLTASHSINGVDSWLTIPADTSISSLNLRRGALSANASLGTYLLTLIGDSYIENATINCNINTTGAELTVRNSDIVGTIYTRRITLLNNRIFGTIDQQDYAGIITVRLDGNIFFGNGRHYVHSSTADTKVTGYWTNNGSDYDDKHWIRLDRTNLLANDNLHNYVYENNSEPYLSKWSGSNLLLKFACFKGNKNDGRGVFSTTTIPFLFLNTYTNILTIVNRRVHWKMFTVGSANPCRTGRILGAAAGTETLGYSEAADSNRTHTPIVWFWGRRFNVSTTPYYQSLQAYCFDSATGEANYDWSFEKEDVDHTVNEFSNGMEVGCLATDPTTEYPFQEYPVSSSITYKYLAIHIDPNFRTSNGEVNIQE